MKTTTIIAAAAAISTNSPAHSETIYYGSRLGMVVTIVSKSGLNTAHAVIRTKHTRENAIAFCRDYVQNVTERCIRQELSGSPEDVITANCNTGIFTSFGGGNYRFLGPNRSGAGADYLILNLATNEIADGTMASGYSVAFGIFKALCPAQVRE